ncbi:carnitine O-palmitoyltransferase 1, liver isoform isoform X1 [Bombus vosnesenskii]|uniref:carnitine O-palmitoyltransferase n=1 Tax=Bombus vosnesenskii TaxID=207650 RepID=A0A6J3L804_9HYME|nr:carnitine O-palmitoyltransferase 1, liver isoform isoform X1 [Bombus vosnesenskii]XP_033361746.1 carnitine O-palmitoyltransferase 1, liver isoform isoform X1 [Bombus vosnesenskii]XP_033361747.1 carnitine O-palmitoyltransferase 1, liver isoform isoform X1 [Bombus vosnesenskii]XP_033361748.1 carnitine O-palmitoyltransferase 1, liver isoform isoform X1 [Bombus vosnesenskii]XP_033361749.1 carnitine O-palmitoyltransferase 1, liver isoform isoform X1 [Bombus vosnesenskii]
MAEAHSAVAFSFSITHEGWDVNFDREVLHLVWQSGIRSWKKRFFRFVNNLRSGVYPASLESLWFTIALVTAIHFAGYKVPYDLVGKAAPYLSGSSILAHLTGSFIVGLFLWLIVIYIMRYILKLLLMYKGWMYESREKRSNASRVTKLWSTLVKLFFGWHKPMLYSFQGSLPRLPLPLVENTMKRYLRSVRPLLDDKNYSRMETLANEFQRGIGVKLQRYLILKSWWATNYVSDWWEEYVYLRGRSPIMVNSNFYGIDAILMYPTHVQVARAASVIYSCLQYRRLIERQELEPILIQGLVPLCSWQYERLFNTTRVPGLETDKIVHYQDSKHIVVYHKGKYFKVLIYHKSRILQACEIEIQMQQILDDKSEPSEGEEKLAALTAGERTAWAIAREEFFSKGVNKASLDLIEKAAFVVALDDVPYVYDPEDPDKLDQYGRILLHGKGYDRWFDKSFTLCIGSNGRTGFNAEHSWADAAVMSHMWEYVISQEITNREADAPIMGSLWEYVIANDVEMGYKEDGYNKGVPEFTPPPPVRLQWDLNPKCIAAIEESNQVAQNLLNDVELRIYVHDAYGKGFMKVNSMSPDAYIQMALQLAYFRDSGKFNLTYEASMTRLFREGRTETVRPCTIESTNWVKAMESKNTTVETKYDLLMAAAKQHQKGYQDAMCGKGIDRHLFCLYVVSKYLEVDSPFLKEVLSEPWKLSTSQTPHGQTSLINLKKHPNCISAGGGFGPVADDGYGVSYIIAGENLIFFHISCKRNSPETNAARFAKQIEKALADMKNLFLERKKLQTQKNGST